MVRFQREPAFDMIHMRKQAIAVNAETQKDANLIYTALCFLTYKEKE